MRSRAARSLLSSNPRLPFTVAAAHQAHLDAAVRAIAAKDARALADALQVIAENKTPAPAEALWRAAGGQGDAAIMDVLLSAHATRREIASLCYSAWQGSVITHNQNVMTWLGACEVATLNYEEKAALAGLAVREGHTHIAREMIAPACALGPQLAEKKIKLLVNYLHACSANDRAELALDILRDHFSAADGVFSPHNNAYHNIVIRAAVEGHARTFQALIDHGGDYLNDDHIGQMLVAALDKNNTECARIAQRFGGDPLAFDNAAIRYAVRNLSTAINMQGAHAEARADEIERRLSVVETLLASGASPDAAVKAVHQWVRREFCAETIARIDACAQGLRARNTARLMPQEAVSIEEALQPHVYRDAHLPTVHGRYEGVLHQAARHRVLDVILRRGVVPMPDAATWAAKNPAGMTLVDLAAASGQLSTLLAVDFWTGRVNALRTMLSVLDEKHLSADERGALVHKVQLETLDTQRRASNGRFKL